MRVVVIGAGVGGATAAALLAKAGHAVTVLEAHIYPGGCAGTFFHKGYRFDAGATLAGGFHPGGPHDIVGRELGIVWKTHPAEPAWRVHLPDRSITRFGHRKAWHAEVDQAFAQSADRVAIARFFRENERVSDIVWNFAARRPAWPPANIGDLLRTASALRLETFTSAPLIASSMGAWARRSGIHDRAARTFLDGQLLISAQTTADNANALFGAAAADLPRKGVNHVEGGIGTIALQLVEAARAQGAVAYYRQQVTRIETTNSRVSAVHTNKGARFECDALVANLTPWDLAALLGDNAPPRLKQDSARRSEQWGAFTVYAGVESSNSDQQAQDTSHHQVIADYDKPLGETNSIFLSFSMPGDGARAPAGQQTLTISTHTRAADWWRLRETPGRQVEYDERVAAYTEAMLSHAERAVPGLRKRIRFCMAGTPVTFKFYTRRHRGGVGGFPFNSLFNARGPWTGLSNAWLVGDSIFPGQSTAGVTMGALRVVDDVMRACSRL